MPQCTIPDCLCPQHCKSLCLSHYRKLRLYGDPNFTKSPGANRLLTPAQVLEIRKLYTPRDPTANSKALATIYAVAPKTIEDIIYYRTWNNPEELHRG